MKSIVLAFLLFTYVVSVFTLNINQDKPWVCPVNEVYYKCSLEICETHCKDLKVNKPCPSLSPDCYKPGCLCREGMLRTEAGVCIPESKCE